MRRSPATAMPPAREITSSSLQANLGEPTDMDIPRRPLGCPRLRYFDGKALRGVVLIPCEPVLRQLHLNSLEISAHVPHSLSACLHRTYSGVPGRIRTELTH